MLSVEDPLHIKRVKQVSYKLNLPEEVVEMALNYTSEYIKAKCGKEYIDPEILLTEEEFNKKLPIIQIPYLGWLKPNYKKYKVLHFKAKQRRELKEKANSINI